MSRIIVFGLDNISIGEFRGYCARGWSLIDANTGGGLSSVITLPDEIATQPWMQLGRMVYIEQPRLPAWAGMIDTPWNCIAPASITAYSAEYLLTLRAPEKFRKLTGAASSLAAQIINEANLLEETFMRPGVAADISGAQSEYTLDNRDLYQQYLSVAARAGAEVTLRAERDESNRLALYLDLADNAGVDTGVLYHDGRNANISITAAKLDRKIINRVVGSNGKQAPTLTPPQVEADSRDMFRLRNQTVTFQGVTDAATLQRNARARLLANAYPKLLIDAKIHDSGDAWGAARPGNTVLVHAANILLPGQRGWRGKMRMRTINYDESQNVLTTQLEATYYGNN